MAAISLSLIKSYMGITVTEYDTIIPDLIAYAYGKLDAFIGLDSTSDTFSEYNEIENEKMFIRGIAKDISLQKVKVDGTEIDKAADISQIDFYKWIITNDTYKTGELSYIEYKSTRLLAQINKILKEIIIFELNKLPKFNNSISKKASTVEGNITEQFVSDEMFYKQIEKELSKLFLRRL